MWEGGVFMQEERIGKTHEAKLLKYQDILGGEIFPCVNGTRCEKFRPAGQTFCEESRGVQNGQCPMEKGRVYLLSKI